VLGRFRLKRLKLLLECRLLLIEVLSKTIFEFGMFCDILLCLMQLLFNFVVFPLGSVELVLQLLRHPFFCLNCLLKLFLQMLSRSELGSRFKQLTVLVFQLGRQLCALSFQRR
jgi:hypothetical protein